jgi:hypothetical protein
MQVPARPNTRPGPRNRHDRRWKAPPGTRIITAALRWTQITGCSHIPPPPVDHAGIDEDKYSPDLAECRRTAFVWIGNPLAHGMREEGSIIRIGY